MTYIDIIKPIHPNVLQEEPLSRHTSFRVGGPAELLVKTENSKEFVFLVETCKKHNIPFVVLGDGSNTLVSDNGLRGVVICTNRMNDIQILDNNRISAQAGAKLSKVAEVACNTGLAGFEFASGIPGTVGGAIYMNAGAYDGTVGEFCESVTLLGEDVFTKAGSEMEFGYRKSYAQNTGLIILDATFALSPGNPEDIRNKMKELNNRRRQTQPLEYPSAGSTFKRPEGYFAGKLIQDSGLKGFSIGGAQISEKHAGFVINTGGATATDIYNLIKEVQKRVYENFGVHLETEVKLLGFEAEL